MDATSLNKHLVSAKSAADSFEAGIVALVERLINNQANVAAYKFRTVAEPVGDGWIEPHPDEVFDVEQMEAKMQASLGKRREQALRAFVRELPDTVNEPVLTAAGRRRRPVEGQIKLNWDVTSPFIAPVLERTGEHIATVTQTTRNKVVSVISDAYQNGLSIDETAKAIRDSIRGSSLGRAKTVARTEMVRLTNGAQVAATKVVSDTAGIGYYKRWLTAPGAEHPRHEDYDGLDGQTVALDALFDVGGEQLDYPGDPDGSPDETCNCRCSLEMVESQNAAREDLEASGAPSAGLPSHETTLEEPMDSEQLADEPMEGQCANCDHAASDHAGEMNDGECTVDECSCQGMEVAKASSDDDGEENASKAEALVAASAQSAPAFVLTFENGWSNVAATSGTAGTSSYRLVPITAATEVALPPEMEAKEELPEENASPEAPSADLGNSAAYVRWNAIFAPEGKATDDGRIFAPGSIGWRDLPLSLMAMTETPGEGGHAGAELCGRIDNVYRDDSSQPVLIRADGVFNDDEVGRRIVQLVDDGFLTGNSVDLAVAGSMLALRTDVVDDEGFWLEGLDPADVEEVDMLAVMFGEIPFDEVLFVITEAVIGMSTVCPFPAFAEASISLAADGSQRQWTIFQGVYPAMQTVHMADSVTLVRPGATLTASAAGLVPVVPPAEWFTNPKLDEYTGLTVTDDGRVYGHAWEWDTCHIGIQDSCTVAPRSETGYAYFLLKEVETDDGQRVECGTITLDTNHAGRHLAWRDAASHYDHTGTAIADVTFGEDEYGGWFSGALRPDASAEAVRKFRGATVSGDWRRIHGNLELVGLLSVNVPGFPVPRTRALVAAAEDGAEVLTLIAAGIPEGPKPADVTEAGLAELALLAEQARGGLDELTSLAERARS